MQSASSDGGLFGKMGNSELRTSSGGGSFARVPYRLGACAARSSARLRFRPDAAAALHDFAYRVAAQRAIAAAAAAVAWAGAASYGVLWAGVYGYLWWMYLVLRGYMQTWEGAPGRTSSGDLTRRARPVHGCGGGSEWMNAGEGGEGQRRKYEYLPCTYTVTQREEHVLLRGHTSWCGHFATASQRGLSVVSTRAYIRVRVLFLLRLQRRKWTRRDEK